MENNRNFFITIALSVLILTLWQVFYMNPKIETEREAARIEQERVAARAEGGRSRQQPGAAGDRRRRRRRACPARRATQAAAARPATQALAARQRVKIDTPSLSGSINLTGARIDDISLKHYRVTVDAELADHRTPEPAGAADRLLRRGRLRRQRRHRRRSRRRHGLDRARATQTLTPTTPVTLTYVNDKGLTFKRTIAVDQDYMFTVSDTVTNTGARRRRAVELWPRHALRQADARHRSTCCTKA